MVYIVTFVFKSLDNSYEELNNGLKSFGTWWHQSASVWLIATNKSSSEIRDYLLQFMKEGDKIYVARLHKNWAASGFSTEEYNWLKNIPDTTWNN